MANKATQVGFAVPLYTREERERRDSTVWTVVQGVLAPVQFLVFLLSVFLICRYFLTGDGYMIATYSIVLKTIVLLIIMVTGAIWEKVVFGQYLMAPAFFWEDIVSFIVITLHLAYVGTLVAGYLTNEGKMVLALCAYGLYLVNAAQFLLKFRAAKTAPHSIKDYESEVIA